MKRTALRRISDRQRARLVAYAKVRKAWLAEHPWCDPCIEQRREREATDVHHRRGRLGSLLTDTRFFTGCCRACHSYITDHPKWAREAGFTDAAKYWNISVPLEEVPQLP